MRLAIVGPVPPYRGGVSQFTGRLRDELRATNDVLTLSWARQYPALLYPGERQHDGRLAPNEDGTTLFVLDYRSPRSVVRAVRLLRRWRPDCILLTWTTTFVAPLYVLLMWLVRRTLGNGVRVVAICHNVLPHERRRLDRFLTSAVLRRVDACLVHATSQLAAVRDIAPGTAAVSVPIPAFTPRGGSRAETSAPAAASARRSPERLLLFFGYVRPYKGLEVLVRALRHVLDHLDVHLVVAGEIWGAKERVLKLVQEGRVAHRVTLLDRYIPDAEVAELFAAADAVVLPYVEATQSAVIGLAFEHGCPVISTRVGGIPELVEDGVTGLLVEPGDPVALASAIRQFYAGEFAERMAAAIRARDSDEGWRRYLRALEHVACSPG